MEGGSALGPDLFIEEMMLLLSQSLARMEVSEHYEVIKELGCGSFGKVQLGKHRFRGTLMALKLMDKHKTKIRCFLREYSVSLYLSTHPFITTAFGIAFESNDHYVFVQEYAPVGDLFDLIQPQVGIPEPAAKRCALQVALALEHLHGQGLVHRDVKPENILLFDRECRCVKLADFGLVRRTGLNVWHTPSSVPYMAPELCDEAAQRLGARVRCSEDVWAYGVLLYSLLTGNFPWERSSADDGLYRSFARWQGLVEEKAKDRSPVGDVVRYLKLRWVVGPDSKPPALKEAADVPNQEVPAGAKSDTKQAPRILRESSSSSLLHKLA
ncbi:serine/threonine-protein kinase SBK1-like [Carcharodon carcharias]|uniref:serine/threonine-protein kinase SBK1-like n=1 Tax=Carcharodon carcharias TaxID=13397 RepID=UPI001B7E6306|nr:serine/threonine-protein kinase SBK1-like [Carcharodon carcharias]